MSLLNYKILTNKKIRSPAILIFLAVGAVFALLTDHASGYIGINLSYLGWMIPLFAAIVFLIKNNNKIQFPILIWLPWIAWVVLYLIYAESNNSFQRTIMLLTPIVVGVAFSSLHVNQQLLSICRSWLERYIILFLIAFGFSTGILIGRLADNTALAAGAITASLLASWCAARYTVMNEKRYLILWGLLAIVPVLAVTRTGIVAVAITLPLVLTPWPWKKRLAVIIILIIAGISVFQMERIQNKMFFSGQGTLEEAKQGIIDMFTGENNDSHNFTTSGRRVINEKLLSEVKNAYWLGHGTNTTEAITQEISENQRGQTPLILIFNCFK